MLNYTFNDINIIKYIIKLTYKAGTVDGKRYPIASFCTQRNEVSITQGCQ